MSCSSWPSQPEKPRLRLHGTLSLGLGSLICKMGQLSLTTCCHEEPRSRGQVETDKQLRCSLRAAGAPLWTRLPTAFDGLAGISEHTLLHSPVFPQSLHPLPESRTSTPLLFPGFLSEASMATAPNTPALSAQNLLEVLGWRQTKGPFRSATISSVRPEPQTTAYLYLTPPRPWEG